MDRSTFLKLSSISAISSLNGLMTLADGAIKKHLVMTKDLSTNRKQSYSYSKEGIFKSIQKES